MKRKEFLRKLGIGIGVAVVAPQVLLSKEKFHAIDVNNGNITELGEYLPQWSKEHFKKYPLIYSECYPRPLINDAVVFNSQKWLVVEKFYVTNGDYVITLRSFKEGDDITITEKNFFKGRGVVDGNMCPI